MALDDGPKVVGTCPKCGARVISAGKTYACEHNTRGQDADGKWVSTGTCDFQVWKEYGGAKVGIAKMRKLMEGEAVEHDCMTRSGEPYTALIELDLEEGKLCRHRERMGTCPKCGGHVLDYGRSVRCENDKTRRSDDGWVNEGTCDFHVPRSVKGVALDDEQIRKLVRGDAVLVRGMEGRKGPFDAFVKVEASDERFWSFEFPDDDESEEEDEEDPMWKRDRELSSQGVDVAATDETREAMEMAAFAEGNDDEMTPWED